jgi:hypothetical protein
LNGSTDLSALDSNGDFIKPVAVASSAAVDATPNSYFYDGSSTVFVQSFDSRNLIGDPYMTVPNGSTNAAFTSANPLTFWISNIDFVGGSPFQAQQSGAPSGVSPSLYILNSTFQGGVADGFVANGKYNIYLQGCRSSNNYGDGYGYHALNAVSPFAFEYNLTTGFNGYGGGGSNQASSVHDSAVAITLNPQYAAPSNQTIHDITAAQRWILGGLLAAPVETDASGNTIEIQNTVQMWLDGTTVSPAGTFTLQLAGTSILHYRNSPLNTLTMTGSGTLVTY